jgi:uncharacterized membrane protein YphA (DoxX/SURF4 family)
MSTTPRDGGRYRRLAFVILTVTLVAQASWTIWRIRTVGFSVDDQWHALTYSIPFLIVAVTRGELRALNALGRVTVALSFLLALWSRFANFAGFARYTQSVLSFMPAGTIRFFAVAATICEVTLCVAMFLGVKTRWASAASAVLLFMFATSMVLSGLSQFEWAVYVLSAGAFVLATADATLFSVDAMLARS